MLDSETVERRAAVVGDLEKEKGRLNTEVESLRAFEREYRSRLKSYFTQQLAALDSNDVRPRGRRFERAPGATALAARRGVVLNPSQSQAFEPSSAASLPEEPADDPLR